MLTLEGLAYALCDYPDMVEDMVETACQLIENTLDQLLPHIDYDLATGWEDICSNSGPLVTKDFFYGVIVPRYKRIGKKLNEHGVDMPNVNRLAKEAVSWKPGSTPCSRLK